MELLINLDFLKALGVFYWDILVVMEMKQTYWNAHRTTFICMHMVIVSIATTIVNTMMLPLFVKVIAHTIFTYITCH